MLKTVVLGSCVLVQGVFVRMLDDGRAVVKVDDKEFTGLPVARSTPAPKQAA